jgi:Uma2 family endonuclease
MPAQPSTLGLVSSTPWHPHPDPFGFTVTDLHALPDDGLRYELIDGSIIVSPSATGGHNIVARWLAHIIEEARPTPHWIVSTDQSATVDERNELRPDLVVYRTRNVSRSPFPITEASMVGEVVSPNSALRDTETKRGVYARVGVPAYWIITTDETEQRISLAELRLDGDHYRYATHYTSDVFRTDHPWPLSIDLLVLSDRWAMLLEIAGQPIDE